MSSKDSSKGKTGGKSIWDEPFGRLYSVLYKEKERQLKHLEGELLTIADAVARDESQREAIKSLIRKSVWSFRINFKEILIQFGNKFGIKDRFLSLYPGSSKDEACQNFFPSR